MIQVEINIKLSSTINRKGLIARIGKKCNNDWSNCAIPANWSSCGNCL